jgi:hypothetical protein
MPLRVRAPNPKPLCDSRQVRPRRRACLDEGRRDGGAHQCDPLAWNAIVDNGQALREESRGRHGRGQNTSGCAPLDSSA